MEKFNIIMVSPGNKESMLTTGNKTSWSRGHCYKLIKECKELPHFAGYSYKLQEA